MRRASFHGLQVCGSVWQCPVCAAKVQSGRRDDLVDGTVDWSRQGGGLGLASLTFPHHRGEDLGELLDKLARAMEVMARTYGFREAFDRITVRGRIETDPPAPAIAEHVGTADRVYLVEPGSFGIAGRVRALEVTHGANGWHPHVHLLLFFRNGEPGPEVLAKLQRRLLRVWRGGCAAAGLPRPSRAHGVDVRDGSHAARYLAKMAKEAAGKWDRTGGWGAEAELVSGHTKKGRGGSRSPWDLLRDAHAGDREAAGLFRTYADAFKGRRQLVWSRGLRSRLGLGREPTDMELAEKLDDTGSHHLVTVPPRDWSIIERKELRGQLLAVAAEGSSAAVWAFIERIAGADGEAKRAKWRTREGATGPPMGTGPPSTRAERIAARPAPSEDAFSGVE